MTGAVERLPVPRRFGLANWRGIYSLYRREVLRFLRSAGESLGGPAVSGLLFLAVFELALGGAAQAPGGVPLATYIAPGIVIFSVTLSAFENAAVPILYDKLEGMIGDIVGAPMTALEIVAGYALSAASNALLTGAVVLGLMALFVDLSLHSPAAVLGFACATALVFALAGVLVGLWAERWDNHSAAETFLMLPLGLLSGAFFPLESLASEARWAMLLNPVFHAVDGFRYGFTGQAQGSVAVDLAVLVALGLLFAAAAWRLFAIGYKIKP